MRRSITLLTVAAMLATMLVVAGPASAQVGCKEVGLLRRALLLTPRCHVPGVL
jgi:hypothetical protein